MMFHIHPHNTMKRILTLFASVLVGFALDACTPATQPDNANPALYQTWVAVGYDSTIQAQVFAPESPENSALTNGGFAFKSDGEFIGYSSIIALKTSPMVYDEFRGGKWQQTASNLISIEEKYWSLDKKIAYTMEIVQLRSDKLVVKCHYGGK